MTLFGQCYEADVRASKHDMRMLKEMGIDFIRLSVNGDALMKAPGIYDWRRVDASMNAILAADLKVYWNWTWLPAWVSEGIPAYREYTNGCAVIDPTSEIGGTGPHWRYATKEERPYCYPPNIPHINTDYVFFLGYDAAKRYGASINWWGAWNEPGGPWYWPPIVEPPYETGVTRLFEEVIVPFTHGVRTASNSTGAKPTFVGPEADGEDIFQRCLDEDEEEYGGTMYHIYSFHPYSWGTFPEDSYARTRKFLDIALNAADDREIWTTEVSDEGTGRIIEWTAEMLKRFPEIDAHTFFDGWSWFEGGEDTWNNGNAIPNQRYFDMQKLIGNLPKRRAVRS